MRKTINLGSDVNSKLRHDAFLKPDLEDSNPSAVADNTSFSSFSYAGHSGGDLKIPST